ncbi:hypothetical protein GW17_00038498 [Ensete ventricosum]|nr:hypothetical protein GW17_00038498 [Ensete ventricosum]
MGSISRRCPFLQRWSRLHGSSQCQQRPFSNLSRNSLVNFFGNEERLGAGGAGGLYVAGVGVVLVLWAVESFLLDLGEGNCGHQGAGLPRFNFSFHFRLESFDECP